MHLILCSFTPLKNALQERWRTSLNSGDPGEHFPCSAQHGLKPSRAKASGFLIPWECLMLEPDYKIKLKKPKPNQNPRRPPSFPDEMLGGGQRAARRTSLTSSPLGLLQASPWHIHQKSLRQLAGGALSSALQMLVVWDTQYCPNGSVCR